MDCKEEKSKFIRSTLITVGTILLLLWIYQIYNNDKQQFNNVISAFSEGKKLECRNGLNPNLLVSKDRGWVVANKPYHITNGELLIHFNRCKEYGE